VVTIASAAGLVGVAKQTDYSASKHAAVGFDESLRVELHQYAPGVRTTVVCPYYIDTGMFEGVKTRIPFLLPILSQEKVVRRIARAIEKNHRVVIMPPFIRLLPVTRALPTPVFDRLMDLFGVNVSMADFVGRQGAARAEPARAEQDRTPVAGR
jgi:all-trans-retinol dehydrogenase (NAD+)